MATRLFFFPILLVASFKTVHHNLQPDAYGGNELSDNIENRHSNLVATSLFYSLFFLVANFVAMYYRHHADMPKK